MGCTPTQSVKKVKRAAHNNGDVDVCVNEAILTSSHLWSIHTCDKGDFLRLRVRNYMSNLDNITIHRSVYAFVQDLPLSQVHIMSLRSWRVRIVI